ncbi:MAG: spondin domain-containing protein [Chloroflexota bacterium]|nr:spondin domain-containing protein [Chloroflexota bacterium]
MKKRISIVMLLAVVASLVGLLTANIISAADDNEQLYVEISLTNLTPGQVLSPVFIARHNGHMDPLYTLGQPASEAVAKMAEDADASDLLAQWDPESNSYIGEAMVLALNDGPIPPGETVSTHFEFDDDNTRMSFISMLVTTNDAFIGANGIDLTESRTLNLTAYDAGSEYNSESCAFIPGPPCGNHVRDDTPAEGYVYVHNGIHGGGDSGLTPATHDWHNPVARMTIRSWMLQN